MNAIFAVILFVAILSGLGYFYRRHGFSFWKLAASIPDEAYEWFKRNPAWFVSDFADNKPSPRDQYTGPFVLAVPSLGKTIKVYARHDQIEQSQRQFIEEHRLQIQKRPFPIWSLVALLYPAAAMLSAIKQPVPTLLILGYGFSNLGYLLGAAFVFPGHFRILGLDFRVPTLIAAVIFWLVGVLLSNLR